MGNERKKFVVVDAMAMAYKAYFAMGAQRLQTSKGEPTSAVYGFVSQLLKLIEELNPDFLAVAYDSKEKTFRHEEYPEYKATRDEMPDDMIPQLARIKELVEAMGIASFIKPGYEADDIVGALVKDAENRDYQSYMATPDKDYFQLVGEKSYVYRSKRRLDQTETVTPDAFRERFGFEPPLMIDYLALVGDASDNIPGVKGIGEKTAAPLIAKLGTIEDIYDNLDAIDSKATRTKLEKGRDDAFLSKKLVTIKTDIDVGADWRTIRFGNPDLAETERLFAELEFASLYAKLREALGMKEKELNVETADTFDEKAVDYGLIVNEKEARRLADRLKRAKRFVFDTETDSLKARKARLAGVSFSTKEGEARFVAVNPVKQSDTLFDADLSDRLPLDAFVEIFKPVFEDESIGKICQHGKYDLAVLRNVGIETRGFEFDTMLASYALDPDQKHGMDDLAKRLLNYEPIPFSEIVNDKKDGGKIFEAPLETLSDYACEDADVTNRLFVALAKKVEEEGVERLCREIEFPLVPVLEAMERVGVAVDRGALGELSDELEKAKSDYTREIFEAAGEEFNVNSTQQLQKILFEKLGLEARKKTKTGYSTDAQTLEELRGEHEIIEHILNYREAAKLKSTYADALPRLIDDDGRLHTTFNQTAASTGRLSSVDPNLQNIPVRSETGKRIRRAFTAAGEGRTILSLDYSQIELRIMASVSGDENLKRAFENDEDIHRAAAMRVFGVKSEDVDSDMRRKAKEVNFGIMYGIGPYGLSTRLGISQQEAREVIDEYFKQFPKVRAYVDGAIESAREKGYAVTLRGRRRYLPNIASKNYAVRQFQERAAINMPIQGTAADMIKLAMIDVHKELQKKKWKTTMVLQVHDELLFDARKEEIEELEPRLRELMITAMDLDVPIKVDGGVGENWLEAH